MVEDLMQLFYLILGTLQILHYPQMYLLESYTT